MINQKTFKYELIFDDGVRYLSPDIRRSDPGWASEFCEKPIRELKFYLPDKRVLILCNFEAYNFFVECSENLGGGKCRLEALYFCGAWRARVVLWKFDLVKKKVFKAIVPWGQEYAGTATRGWRPGLFGERPQAAIVTEN